MSFKTPILCDRRVYDKKGKWKSPNNNIAENVFYYVKEAMTLVPSYDRYNREELKENITIVIFGGKPIIKEDVVVLEDGTELKVTNITINYFESNIMVKDMLKPRIASMEIELE